VVVAGGGHWMKILLMLLHLQLLLLLLQKLVVLHMIGQLSTMHPHQHLAPASLPVAV
jgi:hypothetical protein